MAGQPKLIALDLGERRIGLAVSGPGSLVLPAGYIFEEGLEAPQRQWMSWKDGKLRSWPLPKIGETKRLPGVAPF